MRDRNLFKRKGEHVMVLIMIVLAVIAILVTLVLYDRFKSK